MMKRVLSSVGRFIHHKCSLSQEYSQRSLTTVILTSQSHDQHHNTHHTANWCYIIPVISTGAVLLGFTLSDDSHSICSEVEVKHDIRESDMNETRTKTDNITLEEAIIVAKDLCQRVKDETGCPGLVVCVSIDGKEVWSEGMGYSDIENRIVCHPDTVMRIASISKPITMATVGKLLEEGKLDLDKPVNHYVPKWPDTTYKGEKVTITTRQLVSHIAGIRHYDKNCGKKKTDKKTTEKEAGKKAEVTDADEKEFYLQKKFPSVTDALEIFKNDELCSKPGTEYLYTTHGFTLISAVVEGAAKKKFPVILRELFKEIGMENTHLDENHPLIYGRSRHYKKDTKGRILNAPYVDLSNKWAGGGLLSTVRDLNKFGNAMLYASQHQGDSSTMRGYLKPDTMKLIWSPETRAKCDWDTDGYYGMGWGVVTMDGRKHGACRDIRRYYSHTGGAVGATSSFIVLPRRGGIVRDLPQGVIVSIVANLGSCKGLTKTSIQIAKLFEKVHV